jgi:hypothetical protein
VVVVTSGRCARNAINKVQGTDHTTMLRNHRHGDHTTRVVVREVCEWNERHAGTQHVFADRSPVLVGTDPRIRIRVRNEKVKNRGTEGQKKRTNV